MKLDIGIFQNKCVAGTCTNKTLRDSGCFLCSNENGDDERCVTCIEDHIVRGGTCVECSQTEVCPFNNSNSKPSGASQIHFKLLPFIISIAIVLLFF